MHFPLLWTRRKFRLQTLGSKTGQVVRSSDVVFNKSEMHKVVERLIKLWRVTFSDVPTPLDVPEKHTRAATWHVVSVEKSAARVATLEQTVSERSSCSDSQSGSANEETIISDDPVSPVLPCLSQRRSHPQVKYSPVRLLFTNNDEPNTYEKASTCVNSHKHDNNHVKIRTLHHLYIVKCYVLTNTSKYIVMLCISQQIIYSKFQEFLEASRKLQKLLHENGSMHKTTCRTHKHV